MSLLIAVGLLPAPAFALAPADDIYIGTEPYRLPIYHPRTQATLQDGEGWRQFQDSEGAGWQARFDEWTGTPHRAWGPGIPMGSLEDEHQVERALRDFFARQPDLIDVDPDALVLKSAGYVARTNTWYVDFDRVVDGVPLYRSGVTARIKHGNLILLGIDTHPSADWVSTSPEIGEDLALSQAIAQGPAPEADHSFEGARLVLLPTEQSGGLHYDLTWEIRTRTADPVGIWVHFVDAHNAELVNVHNEVRFLEGHVSAVHDLRTVDGNLAESDVPLAQVTNGSDTTYTDITGVFNLDPSGDGTFMTELRGDWLRVNNQAGSELEAVFSEESFVWERSGDESMAQIDSYIFLHQVRDWGLATAPEVSMSTSDLRSNVNLSSSCNAYYDGNVNFYTAGSGCNNTGRIADVNYHEWGHGFHYYSLQSGSFDGSISEGIGDIISALLTDDALLAPGFSTNGSGIREMESNRIYPDDWVGEVHYDGLIFAGAVWDLWQLLTDELGDRDAAQRVTSQLLADGIKGGPTIPDAYDEFLVADDDDGNLGNGTPHQCQILEAFQMHGLGPGGNQSLTTVLHNTVDNHLPYQDVWVDAELLNLAPDCNEFEITAGTVHFSTDGGENWHQATMTVDSTSELSGLIPPQPDGTIVQYYLAVEDAEGDVQMAPAGGAINPHTFYVGELVELYCTDFEDELGSEFRHELVNGVDELGADDWQLGRPSGNGGDPSDAFSGDQLWGNDLGSGNYNGEYQHDKHNRLYSPAIDVSGGEGAPLLLQFRRWLTIEDGYYDEAWVEVDGEEVWENHATNFDVGDEHHLDEAWSLATYSIEDADGDGTVELAWHLESDQGLAFGGWNIDDVCIYALSSQIGDGDPTGDPGTDPGTDPDGATDGDPSVDPDGESGLNAGGCGCAASPVDPAAAWLMLLVGLVAGGRRRRR